jgi:K+-sensing histidine kinase KdpD
MPVVDGDLAVELQELAGRETRIMVELQVPGRAMNVKGANALVAIVDILIANAVQYAPAGSAVEISARYGQGGPLVEIRDQGPAVAADLREKIFTAEGQLLAKKRADGRYGRVVALLAAGGLARAAGATLEADEDSGRALFRLRPRSAS